MFICEEEILDASYDNTLLCDSVITDGAVVILQKMPVTVSLTDQDTSFSFFVPQVNYYTRAARLCINVTKFLFTFYT